MSRTKPTEVERQELEFLCPRCGAGSGQWCETGHYWSGPVRPSAYLHVLRMYSAQRAEHNADIGASGIAAEIARFHG